MGGGQISGVMGYVYYASAFVTRVNTLTSNMEDSLSSHFSAAAMAEYFCTIKMALLFSMLISLFEWKMR